MRKESHPQQDKIPPVIFSDSSGELAIADKKTESRHRRGLLLRKKIIVTAIVLAHSGYKL